MGDRDDLFHEARKLNFSYAWCHFKKGSETNEREKGLWQEEVKSLSSWQGDKKGSCVAAVGLKDAQH